MSAAISLLRRRSLRGVSSLLKQRQRELEYVNASSRGSHHGFRDLARRERLAPAVSPGGIVQDRRSLGARCGAYRKFATDGGSGPVPPRPPPDTPSSIGTGTKVAAVAVTVAALSWAAAYMAFDVKPAQMKEYLSGLTKGEQRGASYDLVGKGGEAPEPHVVGNQSDAKDTAAKYEVPEAKGEVATIGSSLDAKGGVPEAKARSGEGSNSMLQVLKGVPLMPKAVEEFQREGHGVVESGFEIKEIEDVESSPRVSVENDGSEGSRASTEESRNGGMGGNNFTNIDSFEVKGDVERSDPEDTVAEVEGDVGQSVPSAFMFDIVSEAKEEIGQSDPPEAVSEVEVEVVQSLPSASTIGTVTEANEEVRRSHPDGIVSEVNVEASRSDGPPGHPDVAVETSGQALADTNIEDVEPDAFRKEMQETAKEGELKELADKILYNQTSGEKDEKGAVCSTDAVDEATGDFWNVDAGAVEAVSELAQAGLEAVQNVGVEALQRDVPDVQGIPGLAEAYSLTETIKIEGDEACGEEYGSDQFFKYTGAIEDLEKRQAEADAQFREMLLKLDEEYQQELREARKQHELQAEYANKLKKDLGVEKARWEQEAKQQLQEAEERLRNELKRKEDEARRELEKMELLTQARTNAAVTAEKARQLMDTKGLQLQIEALHWAYSTQSEGARVSHTTHKLAMGAFAFEDAMVRGAPLEEEVELLKQAAGGDDELIGVALESLPEDVLTKGTKTQLQLEREFAMLQGPLRQLALIPAGQGGLLTHAVATAVAAMKVREGSGREGVESVIATVEECLANGELSLAANVLEEGVKGSRAEPFVSDWARHARSRVIAEQALTLVQAHAIATAAGLA